MTDYSRLFHEMQSDAPAVRGWHRWNEPIVPRRDDIRVINPPPPYHWLGREAEALNG